MVNSLNRCHMNKISAARPISFRYYIQIFTFSFSHLVSLFSMFRFVSFFLSQLRIVSNLAPTECTLAHSKYVCVYLYGTNDWHTKIEMCSRIPFITNRIVCCFFVVVAILKSNFRCRSLKFHSETKQH